MQASAPTRTPAIVIAGFMGAGKTTVGRLLARELGRDFVDSDEHLAQTLGRSVREVFASDGEAEFRRLEHDAVRALVARGALVLAVGGGALEDIRTQTALQDASVVVLDVGYDVALDRVGDDVHRPMLQRSDLRAIYERRRQIFLRMADVVVVTDGRTPQDVVAELSDRLRSGMQPTGEVGTSQSARSLSSNAGATSERNSS